MADMELEAIKAIKMARMRTGVDVGKKEPTAQSVEVYSTPTCPYCVMAKQYLSSKNVKYKDIDVSADQAAAAKMVGQTGEMGVPQLHINGQWIIGFNRPAIDEALGL